MAARHPERADMTVEEWRELERTSFDAKHEYIDGRIYLMPGGSLAHSRISINIVRALEDAIGDRPIWVYNSDAAARLSATRYTYPDASVSADERDRPTTQVTEIQAPWVIVEVLSPDSTAEYDRGRKFGYYRACPTVQEYMLVETAYQSVEVYRRAPESWAYQAWGPGEVVELGSINVRIPVAAIYRLTHVPPPDAPEGEV
jgi:Uma2 family endonuclease